MTGLPRLLVIMGSGETSPTMVKTHRDVFSRLGPDPVPAVVLDTPFGFQENADDVSARATGYFRESVGRIVDVASFRRADGDNPVQREASLAAIGRARWVFAGPGSPTYAIRQWAGTEIPKLLADKLGRGGCVTFASAAALTLGISTVPVYEVYKVGADPVWVEGLALTADIGLNASIIPHYDNAEGGNHDTRFCYLGERRLRILEEQMADDAFVLGVDEHTSVVMDLDTGTATVAGLGQLTVRRQGRSSMVPSGSTVPIASLVDLAMEKEVKRARPGGDEGPEPPAARRGEPTPLLATVHAQEAAFDAALERRDADGAVRAILELDDALVAWSRDTLQSDEQDRGRAAIRRMVVKLGQVARVGVQDPRQVVGPYVDALLAERAEARIGRRFADADRVRDRLVRLGVEIRDSPDRTEWDLGGSSP